ncbi:3'5'-cyclic nucleotide phosphodiesterase family protein [Tritrichomonas foetus]|uniref:3'5'-cyclic nucleotide phosphodiesterase family protein n=1 Tax=Tritrichomonas foetus TaxID=1144522 RepID=A0A1J4JJK8_9EUKA|nr:3'5'-cyclic nucleotide phosphodiesterase family protein [Tritrichomonas foetus]|eukprot:OHS97428.1 3'5'-cyclic nucleotide phosphodiesterase family protein [Tritrichomonas foetus]
MSSLSEKKSNFPTLGVNKNLSQLKLVQEKAHSQFSTARSESVPSSRRNQDSENRFEELFDNFLLNTLNDSFDNCIESFFLNELNAKSVTYWHDIPSLHVLYSKKLKLACSHSDGLVGFTFYKREVIVLTYPYEHPAYNEKYDRCPQELMLSMLLFPLWDNLGNVCAVVQVTRPKTDPFDVKKELDLIQYFTRKVGKVYPILFHPPRPESTLLELMRLMEVEQFLLILQKQMEELFNCRCAEIWKLDRATNEVFQFKKTKKLMYSDKLGIVGDALSRGYPINCIQNRMLSSYCEETDGSEIEPVLVIPLSYLKRKVMYAICIRGGSNTPIFTKQDEELLKIVAPYAFLAIDNLEIMSNSNSGINESELTTEKQCIEGLRDLIECISNKSPIEKSIEIAVEKMGLMAHADKSTWYFPDKKTLQLRTLFCTDKDIKTDTISNRTIPARVYANHEVFNIADAYDDFEFDSSVDLETGYKTTSLMAIPIINGCSDVVGVIEFSNRLDNQPFPLSIVKYVNILSTFVSLIMDNEKLQRDVLASSENIRNSLSAALQLTSGKCLQSTFKDIVGNVRRKCAAESGAVYLLDEEKNRLMRFVTDGEDLQMTLPMTFGIAALCFKTKDAVISNDAPNDSRYVKDPLDLSGIVINNLCLCPIISFSGRAFGIVEIANKDGNFTGGDIENIRSLCKLISVSFENKKIKEIAAQGNVLFETNRWIDELEKPESRIPEKLKLLTKQQLEVCDLYFDCLSYDVSELYKIIFYIFDELSLLTVFNISSEKLFSFLYDVRESYGDHPYHGWAHAVDALQFVFFVIITTKLNNRMNSSEILGLCIAALCHNSGYDERAVTFNIATEILHQGKSSVCATRCSLIISILSKRDSNILKNLKEDELKATWGVIVKLIIGQDPFYHFQLIDSIKGFIQARQKENEKLNLHSHLIEWNHETQKIAALILLLKAAIISHIVRPDNISEKWQIRAREEMRLDKQYEKDDDFLVSLKKLNREKQTRRMIDTLAFGNLIAIPVFKLLSTIMPQLNLITESGEANIQKCRDFLYPPEPSKK